MNDQVNSILIVEDNLSLLSALEQKFSSAGFTTLTAKDGKQGLELALKHHPNLIVADIVMPVMDGKEMTRKIREDSWGENVPMIALTNLTSEYKEMSEVLGGKCPQYIIKSGVGLDELLEKASAMIEQGSSCCCVWPDRKAEK